MMALLGADQRLYICDQHLHRCKAAGQFAGMVQPEALQCRTQTRARLAADAVRVQHLLQGRLRIGGHEQEGGAVAVWQGLQDIQQRASSMQALWRRSMSPVRASSCRVRRNRIPSAARTVDQRAQNSLAAAHIVKAPAHTRLTRLVLHVGCGACL